MTTNAANRNRRTFAQGVRATFGRIDPPQAGPKSLLAIGTVCLLITGAASADWKVYDQRVHEQLRDEITPRIGNTDAGGGGEGSVTGNQKQMYDQLRVKGDEFTAGGDSDDKPLEPKEGNDKLTGDKAKPTLATGVDMAERCPGSLTALTGPQAEQHKICEEMYKTEIAKYRFSLEMYELAEKRNKKLQEIIKERNDLNEKEFGKMEENTNKLVALTAQMDNDRDRYAAYINAYDARMLHLQKSSDLLAQKALNGGNGWLDAIPAGVGAFALATALESDTLKTDRECTPQAQQAGVC